MTQNGRRKPETKGQRFARLYLENWRNFQRTIRTEGEFLVGPNASGKSNLLDVFRFLHDIVSVGGGFQQAINKRGGVSSIRCLAARQNSDIVIRAELEGEGIEGAAGYELRFAQDKLRRPLVKSERVTKNGVEILRRPSPEDEADPERRTQTYLEQVNVNREFRDVTCGFLSSSASSPHRHQGAVRVRIDRSEDEMILTVAIFWNS